MKTYLYQIEAVSNLHVGSGEINQGVVDNLVQRDPLTQFPMINASSLKGALRQHFNEYRKDIVNYIFGNPIKNGGNENKDNKAGAFRFFDARMLSIPVRSDERLYFMATCPQILKDYYDMLTLCGINNNAYKCLFNVEAGMSPIVCRSEFSGAVIEDMNKVAKNDEHKDFSNIVGSPSVLLEDKDFRKLCDDNHLPVIARNYLDNGESKNLWYEQVVPRLSKLYFVVMTPDDDKDKFNIFNEIITSKLVQIGGNASVGNGLCRIVNINI